MKTRVLNTIKLSVVGIALYMVLQQWASGQQGTGFNPWMFWGGLFVVLWTIMANQRA